MTSMIKQTELEDKVQLPINYNRYNFREQMAVTNKERSSLTFIYEIRRSSVTVLSTFHSIYFLLFRC